MVYLILGAGFEEAEAIVPCDLLRRAGVEVRLAGIGGTDIPGSHGIPVHADCAAEAAELTKADMLILPGGLGGVPLHPRLRAGAPCCARNGAGRKMGRRHLRRADGAGGAWPSGGPPRHLPPRHGAGDAQGRHARMLASCATEFHHGPRRRSSPLPLGWRSSRRCAARKRLHASLRRSSGTGEEASHD